jgi:hypothetical protein
MDRDIVAMLGAPLLATPSHRRAVAEYIADIGTIARFDPPESVPVLCLFGANERVYPPISEPDGWGAADNIESIVVPGSRFFAIEERPWELADTIVDWVMRTL